MSDQPSDTNAGDNNGAAKDPTPVPANLMRLEDVRAERASESAAGAEKSFSGLGAPLPPRATYRKASFAAAIVAVAAVVGAVGGALATAGLGYVMANNNSDEARLAAADDTRAVKDSMARLGTDLLALKTNVEQSAKISTTQLAKFGDRIEKLEKAQAEPNAKLAKISETLEKLRTAPPAAPAPEVTGSIANAKPVAADEPKKPPILDGWILREVAEGVATVQGQAGIFDVLPGDPLPGLNRVEAIRKLEGRWVVVTRKGLIVGRERL